MASIDKVAIAFSIAIVAVGVGFAFYAGHVQDNAPVVSSPVMTKTEMPKMQAPATTEKTVKIKEEVKIEEKPSAPVEEPAVSVEESSAPDRKSVV